MYVHEYTCVYVYIYVIWGHGYAGVNTGKRCSLEKNTMFSTDLNQVKVSTGSRSL